MNTQQMIELARILVWPVALVVLAIVFRQPLSRLLVTITQLRFRDLEIDFGRELEKLRGKLPAEPSGELGSAEAQVETATGTRSDLAMGAAAVQPLAGVLLAWTQLEAIVGARAGAGLPSGLQELIQGLSDLSSAAAGGKVQPGTLTAEQAADYVRTVKKAEAWLAELS